MPCIHIQLQEFCSPFSTIQVLIKMLARIISAKKVNRARAWRGLFLKSLLLWWSREKNPSSCLGISSYAPLQKNSFLLLKHTNYCVNGRAMLCACICKRVCIFISSRLIFWKAVKSSLKVTQQIQENILIGCCRSSLPKSSII